MNINEFLKQMTDLDCLAKPPWGFEDELAEEYEAAKRKYAQYELWIKFYGKACKRPPEKEKSE